MAKLPPPTFGCTPLPLYFGSHLPPSPLCFYSGGGGGQPLEGLLRAGKAVRSSPALRRLKIIMCTYGCHPPLERHWKEILNEKELLASRGENILLSRFRVQSISKQQGAGLKESSFQGRKIQQNDAPLSQEGRSSKDVVSYKSKKAQ